MNRRGSFAGLATLFAAPLLAKAQTPGKIYRIGILRSAPPSTPDAARLNRTFAQALEERGFVEGRNVVFEPRNVEGRVERIAALAAELVQANCDVIVVTTGDIGVRAFKELTSTVPIVAVGASNPVGDGFASTLARPGGNVTGVASYSLDFIPKQLELLKAIAPGARRVVFLAGRFGIADAARAAEMQRERDAAAKALGIEFMRIEMPAPQDFAVASAAILREHGEALLISPNATNFIVRNEISEFAVHNRLPAIANSREFVTAGLLMSYGNNMTWMFRTTAAYVDKILRGVKPADLPFERAAVELVINLKTAKAIGLTIPNALRLRADDVVQ
jgi:putative tryptophan/tyrosine transport system substrate-binding protein